MKKYILILLLVFLLLVTNAYAGGTAEKETAEKNSWLKNFSGSVNNSFFFVADKIIDLQVYFTDVALGVGKIVLLIALLTAALNHALTGQGLKENVIKIMKATVFFLIVILAYPKVVGYISSTAYELAYKSIYPSISKYFSYVTKVKPKPMKREVDISGSGSGTAGSLGNRYTYFQEFEEQDLVTDYSHLFPDLTQTREHTGTQMKYSSVAPAAVINLIFMLAGECFKFVDEQNTGYVSKYFPNFGNIFKGLICAFFIILTGIFALLEYCICFLEFMLVASVGVILFPLSIWEGSKFLSEKFIGAIIGFFIKLLFCNIVIFLLIYGFVSLFHVISVKSGFTGTPDQIVFIFFTCLMFFYICKSAPGMAQGLLTGVPSLSATGAISAAGGAIAAAGAGLGAAGFAAKSAGGAAKTAATGAAKAGLSAHGVLSEAGAAAAAVGSAGGEAGQKAGAFMSSLMGSAKDSVSAAGLGLARSIMGGGPGGSGGSGGGINPHSWKDDFLNIKSGDENKTYGKHIQERKNEGRQRGLDYLKNHP